jgi:hypothetical protein
MCVSECFNAIAGGSRREWPRTYGLCNRALGCIDILNDLLLRSQVHVYVHLSDVINLFLWLLFFLWLPSLPYFFIGSNVGPNFSVCVYAKITLTNPRKLKCIDFWWSQWHHIHVKFGHNVKQSWICHLIFQKTVNANPPQHVLIMPAQCKWHYIGYTLSDLS